MIYDVAKFCERLKELIAEHEITPQTLASAIGYNEIYHWLSGKYMPSFANLIKLADYFKCSIDFLAGLSDDDNAVTVNQCPPFSEHFPLVVKKLGSNFYRLSKATKIDGRTMYDWVEGQYLPTLENLVKLAAALNCSIDFLVGREN